MRKYNDDIIECSKPDDNLTTRKRSQSIQSLRQTSVEGSNSKADSDILEENATRNANTEPHDEDVDTDAVQSDENSNKNSQDKDTEIKILFFKLQQTQIGVWNISNVHTP